VLKSRARDAAAAARQLIGKPDAALARSLSQVLAPPAAEPAPAPTAAPLPQSQAAADRELMSIFVEEAERYWPASTASSMRCALRAPTWRASPPCAAPSTR